MGKKLAKAHVATCFLLRLCSSALLQTQPWLEKHTQAFKQIAIDSINLAAGREPCLLTHHLFFWWLAKQPALIELPSDLLQLPFSPRRLNPGPFLKASRPAVWVGLNVMLFIGSEWRRSELRPSRAEKIFFFFSLDSCLFCSPIGSCCQSHCVMTWNQLFTCRIVFHLHHNTTQLLQSNVQRVPVCLLLPLRTH